MFSSSSFDRPLRYAELAASASPASSSATEQGKALAWSNLQRLRHSLEELIGPPDGDGDALLTTTNFNIKVGYRLIQCLAPYLLGDREVTLNVDADAMRCWVLLLDLGAARILCAKDDRRLLLNIGDTVAARALSILSQSMQDQWSTTPYMCDVCGLATAALAVQLSSLCLDEMDIDIKKDSAKKEVNAVKIKTLGTRLHATLEKLGTLRSKKNSLSQKDTLKTAETLDHIQAAYMSALHPSKMGSSLGGLGLIPFLLPIVSSYALYDQGWEALESWYVVVGLFFVTILALGAFLAPWMCGPTAAAKLTHAHKISRMLVEMSIHLRPTKADFAAGKKRGIYIVSPGARERKEEKENDAQRKQVSLCLSQSQLLTPIAEEETAPSCSNSVVRSTMTSEEEVKEAQALMTAVHELGKVTVNSLKGIDENAIAATAINNNNKDNDEGGDDETNDPNSVRVPFPKELVEKLEKLEQIMRKSGASPDEVANIAQKVAFTKSLMVNDGDKHSIL